jgi:hypothetical protein
MQRGWARLNQVALQISAYAAGAGKSPRFRNGVVELLDQESRPYARAGDGRSGIGGGEGIIYVCLVPGREIFNPEEE